MLNYALSNITELIIIIVKKKRIATIDKKSIMKESH